MIPINYLAVLVSMIAAMVLGWLWFGALFGKQWMEMMGWTPEKAEEMKNPPAGGPSMKSAMMRSYGLMAFGALVMAFVLAHSIVYAGTYMGVSGISAGLQAGFWSWAGFVGPVTLGAVLWEQKPWKWWILMNGFYLIDLLVMGSILGMWVK